MPWTRLAAGSLIALLLAGCGASPNTATPHPAIASPSPSPSVAGAAAVASSPPPPIPSASAPPATASLAPGSTGADPVPADLQPPLGQAKADVPLIYTDGCHLDFAPTVPRQCVFGDPASHTTIVLFGDSKAGQWFPALERLAVAHRWRLVSITKSACTVADVSVWNTAAGRVYRECSRWRANALARIAAERPSLVVVSDDRFYELAINGAAVPVAQDVGLWDAGLARTLTRLLAVAGSVVLIGDTPRSRVDVPVCLAAHRTNARACATPAGQAIDQGWLAADRATAASAGAQFIDPSAWVCPSDPCPPIIGHLLVYRERDHLTAAFAASLAPVLASDLRVPGG